MFIADLPAAVPVEQVVVVTASRAPQQEQNTAASVTLIDADRVQRLGEPLLSSLLRLVPSTSLATSGPAGSQSQVRIRGAEANHTLLFIDGIRANDPAAGNEPRFELLSTDLGDALEVVRGPQSALWGSEAIGGVVAVRSAGLDGAQAVGEAGSFGFGRLSGSAGLKSGRVSVAFGAGIQGARGINAFADGPGDRDGYRNRTVRGSISFRPTAAWEIGVSGFAIAGRSEFDGLDPLTFARADTLDESRNRLAAGRLFARYDNSGWKVSGGISHLGSRNRNLLAGDEQNRTAAERSTGQLQVERGFTTGGLDHRLIVAGEASRETFQARDLIYGGATDQDRDRSQSAITAEWRAEAGPLIADAAIRRDRFNRFEDATTVRASVLVKLSPAWSATVSYGEGIAQPTFFDLYGFFPGSFRGNADLSPERSRGAEASLRYASGPLSASATIYRQRLTDEIVDVFDPVTFTSTTANAAGRSRRQGLELEAGWAPSTALRLSATYAYLEASERTDPLGRTVKELRRPKHSGSVAADGTTGRLSYGAAISYTGPRTDRDFDLFPAPTVRLGSYWLGSARVGYRLTRQIELFGRIANAFDEDARDVVGYRTEGRSAYAGIRLGLGR